MPTRLAPTAWLIGGIAAASGIVDDANYQRRKDYCDNGGANHKGEEEIHASQCSRSAI
jgi:hypothetical protein